MVAVQWMLLQNQGEVLVLVSLFGGRSAAAQVRVVKGHLPALLLPGFGQLGAAYWALNGHPVLACCVVNWYFPTLTE